ncbi:MAG: hypothetical protein HKN80_10195 [Acidimicrobiia bacterium]|nr:hypothetical protein [Acidimicrobiia bacterium]
MNSLSVLRSAGRTWLLAVVSVPFFMLGLDLLLLPRLFPQYVRRLDLLADEMGITRIAATGPEEPWGLIFLLIGGGLLTWALKDLLFPREMLGVDEHGVALNSLLGATGGRIVVPHTEIVEAAPALLTEGSDVAPGVGVRFTDPSRLPSNPWGAVWVGSTLFIRTAGWTATPQEITAVLTDDADEPAPGYVVDLEADPPQVSRVDGDPTDNTNPERAYVGRSRAYLGGVLALAGVILAIFVWISGTETKAFYLIPTAMGALGGFLFLVGYRSYLEST